MASGFLSRVRAGYGNIYTPHAGSMIIQVQRETGLANRTIVISERQVSLLRILGSRVGLTLVALFLGTWLLFAVQSARVPVLSSRIERLEQENRRIDSLQLALSRMHGRYEQVRQLLVTVGGATSRPTSADRTRPDTAAPTRRPEAPAANVAPDSSATVVR